jgi:hypothetical protein
MAHYFNHTDDDMLISLSQSLVDAYGLLKKIAERTLLESVFKANIAYIRLYDWAKRMRKSYPVVDMPISLVEREWIRTYESVSRFSQYFMYNMVELNTYPWISVSSYENGQPIKETYYLPEQTTFETAFSQVYRESLDSEANQTLITMTLGPDRRIVALANPDRPDFVPTMEKSNVDFIMVEYGHPSRKGLVLMQLPDSVYMVGNEILSKAFVLRYLNHSCLPSTWVFDEDYFIRIIDHNADSLEIRSHQYIVLEKDGYRVMEDEYADMPGLIRVDSIEEFMCSSESEEEEKYEGGDEGESEQEEDPEPVIERPDGYVSDPESEPEFIGHKRTYSNTDTVFVLNDFLDKIDSIGTKPKQD